ncbi:RagB/SusD family nutrient uptake outer membrane protein [Olivibacter sp. SDN3]|uniref:RagB/SusD family nutrient uptake outer membrane protein n=1 Tax=Olivibacter sp. SDN3 TaxID=2764720 RepID=UPI0016517386|nr:RagB/SusD family nutrient uptake outer membrane protein [Olivibacter sp. SDN3]QNL50304.1 RagB/SusD family nutrient uptake outer membrane protein [Olivibacter sp. SDN3]
MKANIKFILSLFIIVFSACERWVEINTPENQLTTDKVFADTATLNGAVANMYDQFNRSIDVSYNKYMGLYTDELQYQGSNQEVLEFYNGNILAANSMILNIWSRLYAVIYQANDIIEQLTNSSSIPSQVSTKAIGEAKFIRAFAYYYLANTFGDVPLILTTDVTLNASSARTESSEITNQIVDDLTESKVLLSTSPDGPLSRTRANRWAATALLSRLLIQQEKWEEAYSAASEVINSQYFTPLSDLSVVFRSGSRETIFQFWTQNGFIQDATNLIALSGVPAYSLSSGLVQAFEEEDQRKVNWTGTITANGTTYYYSYKYKNRSSGSTSFPEYLIALRCSEQYLIRAEAELHLGNTAGAIDDINTIRVRAGLSSLPADLNSQECFKALEQEKRVEMFMEWGYRYIDLKRTERIYNVMSKYKPNWTEHSDLLPIPQREINVNQNLTQNPGY